MARVIPFKAVRPQKKYAGEVASFPYDVLDREEGRAIIRDNPRNFLRVEKSEIDVPDDIGNDDPRVFARARENLRNFIGEGVLFQEKKPCLYVYRQKAAGREQDGVVGGVSVAEYEGGLIKRARAYLCRQGKRTGERHRHGGRRNGARCSSRPLPGGDREDPLGIVKVSRSMILRARTV